MFLAGEYDNTEFDVDEHDQWPEARHLQHHAKLLEASEGDASSTTCSPVAVATNKILAEKCSHFRVCIKQSQYLKTVALRLRSSANAVECS